MPVADSIAALPETPTGSQTAVKPDRSLFWRGLLYFLPWAIALLLTLGFYYRAHTNDELASAEAVSASVIKNGATTMARLMQRSVSDVLLLADDSRLERYTGSLGQAQAADLADDWIKFLRIKQIYDQVRFIDEQGRERLRVNYNDGQPSVVPASTLQNLADRPFFREAAHLSKGELYISPLDLTVEQGEVVRPHKPRFVLRFRSLIGKGSDAACLWSIFWPTTCFTACSPSPPHPKRR